MNPNFQPEHRPEAAQVKAGPFKHMPELLKSIVCDKIDLDKFGKIEGILRALHTSPKNGVNRYDWPDVSYRREVYGSNGYNERQGRMRFRMFVCEELGAKATAVLKSFAMVFMFLGVGFAVDSILGVMVMAIVLLAIKVAARILYNRYSSTEQKNKILVKVNRGGVMEFISKAELVVGDIVQVYRGEQVPADGLFVYGHELQIRESCLKGEGALIEVCTERPHILRGSTVQSGFANMVVMSVDVKTA